MSYFPQLALVCYLDMSSIYHFYENEFLPHKWGSWSTLYALAFKPLMTLPFSVFVEVDFRYLLKWISLLWFLLFIPLDSVSLKRVANNLVLRQIKLPKQPWPLAFADLGFLLPREELLLLKCDYHLKNCFFSWALPWSCSLTVNLFYFASVKHFELKFYKSNDTKT